MQYRKDCSPIETIDRICSLLKKNRIKIKKKYFSLDETFFSYRLELKDFKGIGANGKGFTKDTALASAHFGKNRIWEAFWKILYQTYGKAKTSIYS